MEPTSNNARESAPGSSKHASGGEYLAEQIADAHLALESTLDDLTLDVASAADVRRWVRRYPWAAVGTALVAGFTLGHFVTKSRRRRTSSAAADGGGDLESEQSIEGAATRRPSTSQPFVQEKAGGWRSALLSALFEIVRLAVTQVISAGARQMASRAHRSPPSDTQDVGAPGHPSEMDHPSSATSSEQG